MQHMLQQQRVACVMAQALAARRARRARDRGSSCRNQSLSASLPFGGAACNSPYPGRCPPPSLHEEPVSLVLLAGDTLIAGDIHFIPFNWHLRIPSTAMATTSRATGAVLIFATLLALAAVSGCDAFKCSYQLEMKRAKPAACRSRQGGSRLNLSRAFSKQRAWAAGSVSMHRDGQFERSGVRQRTYACIMHVQLALTCRTLLPPHANCTHAGPCSGAAHHGGPLFGAWRAAAPAAAIHDRRRRRSAQ